MTHRRLKRQDISALAFAAFATLFTSTIDVREPQPDPIERHDPALDGLIDAQTARATGEWFLDDGAVEARLSFEPELERLVWRVTGSRDSVVLDAATGEAIGFEFD